MTAVATHPAAPAAIIAAVARCARIDVLGSDVTMVADAGGTDPGLTNGMVGLKVTVVAGRRCLPVKAVFIMAGIAGGLLVDLLRVAFYPMLPGHPFGHFAAVRAEVTTVTAHPTAAATVIAAMTGGAAFDVGRSLQTVEGRTGFVQPGLSKRMLIFGVAIVAALRSMPIETVLFVTGVANRHVGALRVMPGAAVFPPRVGG